MIRIAVLEDDVELRADIIALLEAEPGFQVVGAFGDLASACAFAWGASIDVAVTDLGLPDGSGHEFIRHLVARQPNALVIVLSGFGEGEPVARALSLGAVGYLHKVSAPLELVPTIRRVLHGGSVFSDDIARTLCAHLRGKMPGGDTLGRLSSQERRLLEELSRGTHLKAAADQLGVTYATARSYSQSIRRKLAVHSTVQAVRMCLLANPPGEISDRSVVTRS